MRRGEGKREDVGEVEAVRNGQIDLPRLPDWNAESAPLNLGDWMTQAEPIMGDLTTLSHEWWSKPVDLFQAWNLVHHVGAGWKGELHPLGIIARLMVIYQPGGLSEKSIILKNLESPQKFEAPRFEEVAKVEAKSDGGGCGTSRCDHLGERPQLHYQEDFGEQQGAQL